MATHKNKYIIYHIADCGCCKMYSYNPIRFLNNLTPHEESARHISADCIEKELEVFENKYGVKFHKEKVYQGNPKDKFLAKMQRMRSKHKKELEILLKK